MGLIFGFALSITFAHFAQKFTIRGGGGGGSWEGAVIIDSLLRLHDCSPPSRMETMQKKAMTARMTVRERAGRMNIVGRGERGLPFERKR